MNSTVKPEGGSRIRRFLRAFLFLVLLLLAALMIEQWRGKRALNAWKQAMTKQGEVFAVTKLWPAPAPDNLAYSNKMAQVIQQLPDGLRQYAGRLTGVVKEAPGKARRGSQAPMPALDNEKNTAGTWQDLDAATLEAEPVLHAVRDLLKNPPASIGDEILGRLESSAIPNFVNMRVGAQSLHAATISELHRGNLAKATENLVALSAYARLYREDPTLVNYMIRVAIVGLSVDVCWDALQAEGWTEPQLAKLQQACQANALQSQMPKIVEAERACRLYEMEQFRSGSYAKWIKRFQPLAASLGAKLPSRYIHLPVYLWRQWLFHPLWCYSWADQEILHYLRHIQGDVEAVRSAAQQGSWRQLDNQLAKSLQDYYPPTAGWRFYHRLPFIDDMFEVPGSARPTPSMRVCPYPNFAKAWFVVMKNLTLQEMVVTTLALKRYQLRHGQWPASLDSLIPEFLSASPRDFMDGQRLRYRVNPEGSFLLYSVGADAQDDGGNPQPGAASTTTRQDFPWDGRDWVWPRP